MVIGEEEQGRVIQISPKGNVSPNGTPPAPNPPTPLPESTEPNMPLEDNDDVDNNNSDLIVPLFVGVTGEGILVTGSAGVGLSITASTGVGLVIVGAVVIATGVVIYYHSDAHREKSVRSLVKQIKVHEDKIANNPGSPNKNDWKKHIEKALNNIKKELGKMGPVARQRAIDFLNKVGIQLPK